MRSFRLIAAASVWALAGGLAPPATPPLTDTPCDDTLSMESIGRALDRCWSLCGSVAADLTDESRQESRTGLRVLTVADGEAHSWTALDEDSPLPERLVLLVHGLDEPGGIWENLAAELAKTPLRAARFDYPNDQRAALSGDALAAALKDLRARGVGSVDLVCHSMGGLIARDVLTREDLYAGEPRGEKPATRGLPEVHRLIMVGTPNRGAPLARLRPFAEAREQVERFVEAGDRDPARLLGFLHDGSGEAGADLLPGSEYLKELNARPLPRQGEEGVAITLIGGQIAQVDAEQAAGALAALTGWALDEADRNSLAAAAQTVTAFAGDGAVPIESVPLEGVEDLVRVEADHRSMLRHWEVRSWLNRQLGVSQPKKAPPAVPIILERLQRVAIEEDLQHGGHAESTEGAKKLE